MSTPTPRRSDQANTPAPSGTASARASALDSVQRAFAQTTGSIAASSVGEAARRSWSGLSPSGQRAVTIAATALVIGLAWAFIYQPLQQARERDRQRITQLRAELAQMQTLARERQSLVSVPNLPTTAGSTGSARASVASLQAALGPALKVSAAGTSNNTRTRFNVIVSDVGYTDLIDRLSGVSQRYQLTALEMQLTRKAGSGQSVSGTLTLAEAP